MNVRRDLNQDVSRRRELCRPVESASWLEVVSESLSCCVPLLESDWLTRMSLLTSSLVAVYCVRVLVTVERDARPPGDVAATLGVCSSCAANELACCTHRSR